MTRVRSSLLLALVLGTPSWAAHTAHAAPAPVAVRAQVAPRFRSPFRKGLQPLSPGALVTLQGREHVTEHAYKQISAATQHLLSTYPADSHFFVGIGRDPAPIIAFLQNLGGKELAINFPASSNEASRATPAILAEYVKKLIPPGILESGRTIVFVDATTSGRALNLYVPLITPSLNGANVVKAAFGVQHSGHKGWPIFATPSPGGIKVIDTTPFPEVNRFFTEPYEDVVSEFPRHGPGTHHMSALDTPLPQYGQFRQALMQRMERDEELHGFLLSKGGAAFHME